MDRQKKPIDIKIENDTVTIQFEAKEWDKGHIAFLEALLDNNSSGSTAMLEMMKCYSKIRWPKSDVDDTLVFLTR